jgi:pimeloyl-ACP methyl ester carboxylesterase
MKVMSGATPPLVLLHGFPLDRSMWAPQVEAFRSERRLIVPDLRGFGDDIREVSGILTMEGLAADLRELLDREGVDRAVLCGLSMGGYVAMAFAERWPERLAGLVLANTRSTADDAAGRAARERMAADVLEKGTGVVARAMLPKLFTPANLARQDGMDRIGAPERVRRIIARQRPATVAAAARGMALRPDRTAVLHRLRMPALVITGDADQLMPMHTSEHLLAALPNASLAIVAGSAHLPNLERPEAFNEVLANHLDIHHGAGRPYRTPEPRVQRTQDDPL